MGAGERGRLLLETGAFISTSDDGARGFGAWVAVALPLDRLWTPKPPVRMTSALAEGPAPDSGKPSPEPSKKSAPSRRASSLQISPVLARACVAAAWRANGLGSMADLESMSGRARSSGLLPEARLGVTRSWDRGQKLTPTNTDPYRLQDSTSASQLLEGKLTWRLDRLLFADDEVAVEKLRVQRIQQRAQLAGKVLQALFAWQRARLAAEDASLRDDERLEAWLGASEAEATLDVLTGGWFARWLASSGG